MADHSFRNKDHVPHYPGPLFISHASRDHDTAYPIAAALDASGSSVFYLNHPTDARIFFASHAPFAPLPSTHRIFGDLLWPSSSLESIDDRVPRVTLQQVLFQALDRCRALVVIMTPEALASSWVQKEVRYYQRESQITQGRPTIGITLVPCQASTFTLDAQFNGNGQSPAAMAATITRWLAWR